MTACGKIRQQQFCKTFWQLLIKLNLHQQYDSAILILGIYPREIKAQLHTKICTLMFLAAKINVITKTWKQPKRPPKGR